MKHTLVLFVWILPFLLPSCGRGGFVEYLKRCNFLLLQGRYVADAAYFIGEDAPKMTGVTDLPVPEGYSFDYINADVLRHHARVQDGKLVLDDLGFRPDFTYSGEGRLLFIHRTLGSEGEIYFVSNQEDRPVQLHPSFRVNPALKAELWDPFTGQTWGWDGEVLSLDQQPSFRGGGCPAAFRPPGPRNPGM